MLRTAERLRDDALRIWRAGVDAVHPSRLIPQFVQVDGGALLIGDAEIPLTAVERIVVVGGGKASGAMAAALEQALGPAACAAKKVTGWVNVPADAVVPTEWVRLHAARPPGVNEPTPEAAAGVREMLRLVAKLGPRDLAFCLLSGGGSALLPAPIDGFSLQQKTELTRELSARGATISQMNAVRRELSEIKGGGLARACRAGRLASLILSDVPGDDLSTIASGPTVLGDPAPDDAIGVLQTLGISELPVGRHALDLLRQHGERIPERATCRVTNLIIGNNATAVDSAGVEAERLGYSHAMIAANAPEGPVEDVAHQLVEMAVRMRDAEGPDCLISGGEPTVRLAPEAERGRGGRNQQLCLAALASRHDWRGMMLLSGGTDGEDGPTDAAGAWVDERVAGEAERLGLNTAEFLARNDAYTFFEQAGGLFKTGATQTNVCDLRVITVSR